MNRKDGKQEAECKWHNLVKQIKALLSEEPHCSLRAELTASSLGEPGDNIAFVISLWNVNLSQGFERQVLIFKIVIWVTVGWKCVIKDEEMWWSERNRLLIAGLSLPKVSTNLHPGKEVQIRHYIYLMQFRFLSCWLIFKVKLPHKNIYSTQICSRLPEKRDLLEGVQFHMSA